MTTLTLPKAGPALAPKHHAIHVRQVAVEKPECDCVGRQVCKETPQALAVLTAQGVPPPPMSGTLPRCCPPGRNPVSPSPPPPSYFFK